MDFLNELRKNLDLPPNVKEEVVAELESHYAWTLDEFRARGRSESEAAAEAARQIGDPGDIARRLQSVHIGSTWRAAFLTALPFLGILFLPQGGLLALPQLISADAGMWERTGWCLLAVLVLGSLRELLLDRRPVWLATWLAGSILLSSYWHGYGFEGIAILRFLMSYSPVLPLTVLAAVTWRSSWWKWVLVGLLLIRPFSQIITIPTWGLAKYGYLWGPSLGIIIHWCLKSALWVGAAMGVFWKHRYGNSAQVSLFLYSSAVYGILVYHYQFSQDFAVFAVLMIGSLGVVSIPYARASSLVYKRAWLAAGLLAQAATYIIIGDSVIDEMPGLILALHSPPYNLITQLLLVLVVPMWVEMSRGDAQLEIATATVHGRSEGMVGRIASKARKALVPVLEEKYVLPVVVIFTWAVLLAGYVWKSTGTTERISVSSDGQQAGNAGKYYSEYRCSISADGRYVAFSCDADNLVAGDTNGCSDVFVRDRLTGETQRVSVSSSGEEANGGSGGPSISADGRYVAFVSGAQNLVNPRTSVTGIYVRDTRTGKTEAISVAPHMHYRAVEYGEPAISTDGRFVAFTSDSPNLVPGDTNEVADIFVRDRKRRITERVSISSRGQQANGRSGEDGVAISADGLFVVFMSEADNLVPGPKVEKWGIFIHDRRTGDTERVSVPSSGEYTADSNSYDGGFSVSADGRYVVFSTDSQAFVPGALNRNIYVRDRQAGAARVVSVPMVRDLSGPCYNPSITPDGRFVVFCSLANNLTPDDANGRFDIFVRDLREGRTLMVSISQDGVQGNANSGERDLRPAISADGRVVAFPSDASNLVRGDTNGRRDLFVREIPEDLGSR